MRALRLTRWHVGEVDPADDTAAGDRRVGLRERERMPHRLLEPIEPVPLEEHAAIVAELPGGDLVAVGDLQFADLHRWILPTRGSEPARGTA